jgi:hypothetical protein
MSGEWAREEGAGQWVAGETLGIALPCILTGGAGRPGGRCKGVPFLATQGECSQVIVIRPPVVGPAGTAVVHYSFPVK